MAELLNKSKIHIVGSYAVRQLRSNDTEVFVQSISQQDAALNVAQPKDFCVVRQDRSVEVLRVPLGTMIQGWKNADNCSVIYQKIRSQKFGFLESKLTKVALR